MKTLRQSLVAGLLIALALSACRTNQSPVNTEQLEAFMNRWETYEPFKIPMDPKDEPLLLAALEEDPNGPWAAYVSMKFSQTKFEARQLDDAGRTACYRASLNYLIPARDSLTRAVEVNPADEHLQEFLNEIKESISLVTLETGEGLEKVEADAWAALAKNSGEESWNTGNIIFEQHTKLGRIALRNGDIEEAKKQLLASGRTPGSPQLNSFGPDLVLARELAEKGAFETVIEFLDLVACFWANPDVRTEPVYKRSARDRLALLEAWKKDFEAGKIPDHRKWK